MNFVSDGAVVGFLAIGLTFVIISGGIDLSVGSMVGLSGILTASLIEKNGLNPWLAILISLFVGAIVGAVHGLLISKFDLAPFLVTLGGLFFCRGIALCISKESIQIKNQQISDLASWSLTLPGDSRINLVGLLFLVAIIIGSVSLRQTRFGRNLYAIGGDSQSAILLGVPVAKTISWSYILSGFCSAFGGVAFVLFTSSGNAIGGTTMELDAIAAVVIGGTLLSGGYGSIMGSLLGILILGIIQTAITFQGTLSSWWTKIAIGALLLIFMLIQRAISNFKIRTI